MLRKSRKFVAFLLSVMMLMSTMSVNVAAEEAVEEMAEIQHSEDQAQEETQEETYNFNIITEVFEYGQDVIAVAIDAGVEVDGSTIDVDTFSVSTKNLNPNNSAVVYEGPRAITKAYVNNEENVAAEGKASGRYIILELEYGYGVTGATTLIYTNSQNLLLVMNYEVAQQESFALQNGEEVAGAEYTKAGEINLIVDDFAYGEENGQLYRLFTPEDTSVAQPLVVWMHGGGESGTNNEAQLRANMGGTAWASPENQAVRPAYVLAGQASNGWTTTAVGNLRAVVDALVDEGKVDPERIYIAGCSMGGGGTWTFMLNHPDLFAAAIPICAAGGLTEDQVDLVKDIAIWLVHAENDTSVLVDRTRATYNLLVNSGHEHVYYTEFEDVGEYNGHWSWIPVLNNFEDEELGAIMAWLFAQSKPVETKGYDFEIITEVFEYGQDVIAVAIDAGELVDGSSINADTFSVSTTNLNPNNNAVVYEGSRAITKAYVNDEANVAAEGKEAGRYIILELAHGFGVTGASTLIYTGGQNLLLVMNYEVAQQESFALQNGEEVANAEYTKAGEINLIVDDFAYGEENGQRYRLFTPEDTSEPQPIVVWMHGGGESGTNNEAQLRANMGGTAWASPENQAVRPAYVLAGQASNGWNATAFANLKAVVDALIEEGKVDPERVYIAGCSMGGGGTWNFVNAYPEYFAAAIPICAAGNPSRAQAELLMDMGIWLFHAANDPTVGVNGTRNTYNTFVELGHQDVYYTEFEDMGEYNGHWSWIPVLNNYEDEALGSVMAWLFAHRRTAAVESYDFEIITEVFEYGQDVIAVAIDAGELVDGSTIDAGTFSVSTTNLNPNNSAVVYEGPRAITKAYVNDEANVAAEGKEAGRYIILELAHGYGVTGATTLIYTGSRNHLLVMNYEVVQQESFALQNGEEVVNAEYIKAGEINLIVDDFAYGEYNGQLYRLFIPEDTSEAQPIVIWMHGMGEGGTNNEAQIRANMGGTAWASPENQAVRPAYVLAGQAASGWNAAAFANLKAVVDTLVDEGKVDPERIYIAGCSMGGGATWNFVNAYPEYFAAAIPICAASNPSRAQAELLMDMGIWLFHAANDPTVGVNGTRNTYNTFVELGHQDAHYTEFEDMGEYNGHWSWIPVLNNYEDEALGSVMAWLFAHRRPAAVESFDFEIITEVFDYGQAVIAVAINAGELVDGSTIDVDTFSVSTTNLNPNNDAVVYEGPRAITKAYVNDEPNVAAEGKGEGQYIILELEHGYTVEGSSALVYQSYNYVLIMNYEVAQNNSYGLVNGNAIESAVYSKAGEINLIVDEFTYGNKDGLNYRLFTPEDTSEPLPLVLWLHGSGETGTNNESQIRANMGGTAWASPENQAARPAYVLAPQSSMRWSESERTLAVAIIDELVAEGKVDKDRIYISGCSMGGNGTWDTIQDFPEYFAGAIIIATGMLKSDEVLTTLTHLPIWLVNTGNDVYPGIENAYLRMQELGGIVQYTHYEAGSNGPGYNDHWAWVPVLHNLYVDEYGTDYMTWLFGQERYARDIVIHAGGLTTIKKGATLSLNAEVTPYDTKDSVVTWSSSNESVATVDENGVVTGIASGSVRITATTGNGLSYVVAVRVTL